jgi:hypothetical protein
MKAAPSGPSTRDLLDGIRNDLLQARLNFDIYRVCKQEDSRKRYWPVMITYENFFSTSLRAHFDATVAALGRVFDNDPRNVSIETLLKTAPSFQKIASGELASAKGLWQQNAKKLRHEMVAHHAAKITAQEVIKRANITLDDIERLISSCETLMDAWTKHAGCHVQILSGSKADTLAMLEALLEVNAQP